MGIEYIPQQQAAESIESMAMLSIPQYETSQPTKVIEPPKGIDVSGAAMPRFHAVNRFVYNVVWTLEIALIMRDVERGP